jgi:hypothetical protein
MSNNSYNFYPRLDGLQLIEADSITTSDLTTNTLTATSFKTNLVQSINPTNNLTLEALTTGQVIIKSNGANIAVFDTANNLITFNNRVTQIRSDTAVSYGSNCLLTPTYVAGTSGLLLTAFGSGALQRNTTGNYNSAFGNGALTNVLNGSNNVGFGAGAGQNINSGSGNMCIGLQSCLNTTSAGDNVGVGTQSGFGYTTGGSNVCIGTRSGVLNTSFNGSNNTSIGTETGQASAIMNSVTSIGRRANYLNTIACSNSTAIGALSANTTSNQIILGTTGQFTSTDNMSIGKTTTPTTKFDVEGASLFNGIVSVRNGNNLQIFNNGNTQQTNAFMLNNDFFINNSSSSGSIQLRINGNTRFNLTDTNIFLGSSANLTSGQYNVCLGYQSCQALTSGIDNIALGLFSGVQNNTVSQGGLQRNISIGREAGNALNGSENITLGWRSNYLVSGLLSSFTNSVVIGNNLNNTLSNQILIGSGSQFITTPKISVGKLTSPVQTVDIVGTLDVTGNITTPTRPAGTNDTSVATTAFVQNAVSSSTTQTPTTSKYLFDECWDSTYNQCPIGGYNWTWNGTGSNGFSYGDNNHIGQYNMAANKGLLSSTFYHYPLQEITFIARTTNSTNTGDMWVGLAVGYSSYARSSMIKKTTATNTFTAVTNNVTKGTFSSVTWVTNVWYEFKITFSNPNISYKITRLDTNATETITDTTAVFDFANTSQLIFQIANGGGSNTADLDFVSVSYQVPSRS